MNFRSTFAKSTLAGVAGVMALSAAASVPTFAAAQSAGYYGNGGYYDPCQRDTTNRSTVGALVGGASLKVADFARIVGFTATSK